MLEDEEIAARALELHAGGLGGVSRLDQHLADRLADEDLIGARIGLDVWPGLLVGLLGELDHRGELRELAHIVDRGVGDPRPEDDRGRLGAARDVLLDLLVLLGLREIMLEDGELVAELFRFLLRALDLVGAVDVRRRHDEHHQILAVAHHVLGAGDGLVGSDRQYGHAKDRGKFLQGRHSFTSWNGFLGSAALQEKEQKH